MINSQNDNLCMVSSSIGKSKNLSTLHQRPYTEQNTRNIFLELRNALLLHSEVATTKDWMIDGHIKSAVPNELKFANETGLVETNRIQVSTTRSTCF